MFSNNVGSTDKYLRIVVGVILIAVMLFMQKTMFIYILGVVGVVLVLTAIINFCPLYSVLGIKTNKTK